MHYFTKRYGLIVLALIGLGYALSHLPFNAYIPSKKQDQTSSMIDTLNKNGIKENIQDLPPEVEIAHRASEENLLRLPENPYVKYSNTIRLDDGEIVHHSVREVTLYAIYDGDFYINLDVSREYSQKAYGEELKNKDFFRYSEDNFITLNQEYEKKKIEEKVTALASVTFDFFRTYNIAKKTANNTIDLTLAKKTLLEHHNDFMREIWNVYTAYKKASDEFEQKLLPIRKPEEIARLTKDLDNFFKHGRHNAKYTEKYNEEIAKVFNHEVKPERWCANPNCSGQGNINEKNTKRVIEEEANIDFNALVRKKYPEMTSNIKPGLSYNELLREPSFKRMILSQVKKRIPGKDLLSISKEEMQRFDFSYEEFKQLIIDKIRIEAQKEIYQSLQREHSKLEYPLFDDITKLPLELDWKKFLKASRAKKILHEKLNDSSFEDKVYEMFEKKDLSELYHVYISTKLRK